MLRQILGNDVSFRLDPIRLLSTAVVMLPCSKYNYIMSFFFFLLENLAFSTYGRSQLVPNHLFAEIVVIVVPNFKLAFSHRFQILFT